MKMTAGVGNHALHDVIRGHEIPQVTLVVFQERDLAVGRRLLDGGQGLLPLTAVFRQDGKHGQVGLHRQGERMEGYAPEQETGADDHRDDEDRDGRKPDGR